MTLIMPTFPRRTQAPQAPAHAPDPYANQPRGQVAIVWADGETHVFKPDARRWERQNDNPPVATISK